MITNPHRFHMSFTQELGKLLFSAYWAHFIHYESSDKQSTYVDATVFFK